MERRIALQLIAAGVLAPAAQAAGRGALVSLAPAQAAALEYAPKYFSVDEMSTLQALTEIIIPEDEHSPGAAAAHVDRYIDVMLSNGSAGARRQWRDGLASVDAEARKHFSKPFRLADSEQQDQVVATMARHEGSPETALEKFFAPLKRMTIDGYYTSKIGIHEDLEYKGNTALSEFPGCTHPEHQA